MPSIDSRITALINALERRKMEQEGPVDALSQSLYELGRELSGLELNSSDLLGTMPLNLTALDLERMIEEVTR